MSYGIKYLMSFISESIEYDYEIRISERDYSGDTQRRNLGGAPVLVKDSNGVISGTSLEMMIETKGDGDLREFYTEDNKKFKVEVLRDGTLYWAGFIVTEKYAESMEPYSDIAVTATDGLGLLKKEDYGFTGRHSILEIIKYCTDKTGLTLGYEVKSGIECLTTPGEGFLKEAYVNAEIYEEENCYKSLSAVLENFGLIITQAHVRWYLSSEAVGGNRIYYNSQLDKEDLKNLWDNTMTWVGALDSNNAMLFPVGMLDMEMEPARKDLKVIQEYRTYPSYFLNYNFSGTEAWEGAGEYATLQGIPCRFIKGIYGDFKQKFSQEIPIDSCGKNFRFELKYAVLTSNVGAEHKIEVYVQNIRNANYVAILGENGWTQQAVKLTLKADNLTSVSGGELKWNTFILYTDALPEPGKLRVELSCVSGPGSDSELAGVYYAEVIAINEIPGEIENKRTLSPESSEDAEDKRLIAGSCYDVTNRERIVASAIEVKGSLDPRFYIIAGPTVDIEGTLHHVMAVFYGNIYSKARRTLKGTILYKYVSDKRYNFGFDHLFGYEYDRKSYILKDASYNLLTDEIDCTLIEAVDPVNLPTSRGLAERSVDTGKTIVRSVGNGTVRTYGGTETDSKMIRELDSSELSELTPETYMEIDYPLSSKTKRVTMGTLREYFAGNWFYEKDGLLYCRLDLVGEKGISAYGTGPDGGPGGGWDLIDNLTSARTDAGLTANMGRYLKSLIDGKASDWAGITGKPDTFTPSAHTHPWGDLTGKPSVFPTTWENVSGRPDPDSFVRKAGDTMTGALSLPYLSFPEEPFNASAPARSTLSPMSLKIWDSYNTNIGLSASYATILEIYGKSRHWDNQLAFDGFNGSIFYRSATYNDTSFCAWRKLWDSNNHGPGSGMNADMLDGYHRNNLYTGLSNLVSTIGNEKSITVSGDADTYYPVVITGLSGKTTPNIVSVYKNLGSVTPASWVGNHSNGTSSCYYIYEYRSMIWDGNGGYLKTLRAWAGYARVNAHVSYSARNNGGLILWLRGGGSQYYISCNNPFFVNIYYEKTELGSSSSYPDPVEPRTTIGNTGILSSEPLGYGNISGTAAGLQTVRKLWGQNFNGTADVSGNMTGVGSVLSSDSSLYLYPNTTNPYLRFLAGGVSYYCQAISGGIHLGVSGTKGLLINSAGRGSFSDGLSVGYGNTSCKLSVADFICNSWVRTNGNTGWYSETYGGGIYMIDTTYIRIYNNKRFFVSNEGASSVLTQGGFTREGYAGSSWFNGHGALNVAISNNSSQTPLLVAYRAGQTPAVTGTNRLFSLELHNTGTTMYWAFGGARKFEFTSTGNFLATGEVTAYSASDVRLKENVRPLDGLSYIDRLRPVEFDWNARARELSGDDRRHSRGLIAQEVQNVLPDIVGNVYNSEYLGIRYEKLIPILLAAVKQLSEEVKRLKCV